MPPASPGGLPSVAPLILLRCPAARLPFSDRTAGERAVERAVFDGNLAVDDDVFHAGGEDFGLLVGGAFRDRAFIENDNVCEIAGCETAAFRKLESFGDERTA